MKNKCGTCKHFIVKPDEIELAIHAPHISACQPGQPHCLGGQVRGACAKWNERAELGLPMPWGDGPMVESTFGCKLWEPGGPTPRSVGSFNRIKRCVPNSVRITGAVVGAIGIFWKPKRKDFWRR